MANGEWRVEIHYSLLTTRYSLLTTRHWQDEGQDTANALVGMQVLPVPARMACGSNRVGGRKHEPAKALGAVGIPRLQAGEDINHGQWQLPVSDPTSVLTVWPLFCYLCGRR